MIYSKMAHGGVPGVAGGGEEAEGSFQGSLSTLVASDDDLAYINAFGGKNPNHPHPGGSSAIGWDYLLNWGPNFDNLSGVFKDIAQLPDIAPPPGSEPSSANHPTSINLGNSGPISRSSRYPTPRPSEEYV